MKPEYDKLSDMFAPAKETGLTMSEQQDMWQSLKSYAEFHPAKRLQKNTVLRHSALSWAYATFAGLLLFVGTGYAAQDSLPGEPLYVIKVEVMEPLLGNLETSEDQKLAYQVSLLERRLEEIQLLEEEGKTEQEITNFSSQYIEEHVTNLLAVVSDDTDMSIPEEAVVRTLNRAKGITRAYEVVSNKEQDNLSEAASVDVFKKLDERYNTEVETFATNHPAEAVTYITTIIDEFDDTNFASSTESLQETARVELHEVSEALQGGSIKEALEAVSELQEEVIFTEYLKE